jgi:ribose transport system permease protein
MKKALGILVVLILAVIYTTIRNGQFVDSGNLENLLYRTALFGVISIGVSFVIVTGGIDLSIGSVIALTGCLLPIFLTVTYEPLETEQKVVSVDVLEKRIVLSPDSPPLERDDRLFFHVVQHVTLTDSLTVVAPHAGAEDAADSVYVEQPLTRAMQPMQGETGRTWVLVAGEVKNLADVPEQQRFEVARIEPASRRITLAEAKPALAAGERVTLFTDATFTQERRYNVAEASQQDASGTIVQVQELPQDLKAEMSLVIEKARHMNTALAIGLVLAVCVAIGLTHGLLITKLNLRPFVVTLCGLLFYRGLARFIADDNTMGFGSLFGGMQSFAASKAFYVPIPCLRWISGEAGETPLGTAWVGIHTRVVFLALLALAAIVVMNYSVFGRYLMALGRNEEAARLSGINTGRMIVAAYVICSVLAGVAGILFVLEYNNVAPSSSGSFYELWAIAAAVLGGCSLRGGEASVLGVIVGAAIMQVLSNLILLDDMIPQNIEFCILAVAILTAVIFDELLRRYMARRRARHEATLAEQADGKK